MEQQSEIQLNEDKAKINKETFKGEIEFKNVWF